MDGVFEIRACRIVFSSKPTTLHCFLCPQLGETLSSAGWRGVGAKHVAFPSPNCTVALQLVTPTRLARCCCAFFCCFADCFPLVSISSRRCVRSGDQCMYSVRRQRGDRAHMQQYQPQGPDRDGVNADEVLLHSTTGALITSGVLPLKR